MFLCVKIEIELLCPNCPSAKIKKNGKKSCAGKQNYYCKDCRKQFTGDHAQSCKGCFSQVANKILLMLVRGMGIRNVSEIEGIGIKKVLSALVNSNRMIVPEKSHYENTLKSMSFGLL